MASTWYRGITRFKKEISDFAWQPERERERLKKGKPRQREEARQDKRKTKPIIKEGLRDKTGLGRDEKVIETDGESKR